MSSPASSSITCQAEPGLLLVRWAGEVAPATLRAGYESVLAQAATPQLLLDVRHRGPASLEALNWVLLNWLPRAAARFAPHILRVAYLVGPERAAELTADPFLHQSLHDALAPRPSYRVALFADEAAARAWLRS